MKKFTYGILMMFTLGSLFLLGCDSPDKVHVGDTVSVTYVATFPDGTAFQSSGATFTVGSGTVIAGLEDAVLGMKAGKVKTTTITPDKGYGSMYNDMKVQRVSKLVFDKIKVDVKNGTFQKLGDNLVGIIRGIEKDTQGNDMVLYDINPRETWDNLIYQITLVSKQ